MARRKKYKAASRGPCWSPEALARREKLLGPNPWGGFNHSNLGCEFSRMGAWEHAVAEFERAVEINPWQPAFKANLSRTYLGAGRLEEARAMAAAALRQAPGLPEAMYAAAIAEEKLGNAEAAISWYRKALKAKLPFGLRRDAEEALEVLLAERGKGGD